MYLGIDIGSVSANAVIVNKQKEILGYSVLPSGYDHHKTATEIMKDVCQKSKIEEKEIQAIVGTGYGRNNVVGAVKTVTEITCHAVGVHHLFPDAKMVIDIGGQDSKIIWISEDGFAEHFVMNDKCSAGTGRFLEVMANIMKMDLREFAWSGYRAQKAYPISSTCTVFAESEVISAVSMGVPRAEIAAGIFESITKRIAAMIHGEIDMSGIILTGGVAQNIGVVKYLKKRIAGIEIPEQPQITGALGAALLAREYGRIY